MIKKVLIWRDFLNIGQTTGEILVLQFLYLSLGRWRYYEEIYNELLPSFPPNEKVEAKLDSLFKRGLLERKSRPFCGMERVFWRANYGEIHKLADKQLDKPGFIVALIDDLTL